MKCICRIDVRHIITYQKLVEEMLMKLNRLSSIGAWKQEYISSRDLVAVIFKAQKHLHVTKSLLLISDAFVFTSSQTHQVVSPLFSPHSHTLSRCRSFSPSISLVSWFHYLFFITSPLRNSFEISLSWFFIAIDWIMHCLPRFTCFLLACFKDDDHTLIWCLKV